MRQLNLFLRDRAKPYKLTELRSALRAIGRSLPYLSQLRRRDVIEQIPDWLTTMDQGRLFEELERSRVA